LGLPLNSFCLPHEVNAKQEKAKQEKAKQDKVKHAKTPSVARAPIIMGP